MAVGLELLALLLWGGAQGARCSSMVLWTAPGARAGK
jgi:hypothetical protein